MNNLATAPLPAAGVLSLAYMVVAAIISVYLARKTEYFWISLVLLVWLLGQPVLNAYYVIELGPFDLQPNRLLLLFLIVALPYVHLYNVGKVKAVPSERRAPPYEPYMVIFVCLVVIAMAINWDALPPKRLIAIPLEPITLVLLYYFIKRIITRKVFDAMTVGLIVMAIGSSIIALIQVVDPMFLRTGPLRIAFGGLWRAYGPFSSEYILGSFQIVALFLLLTFVKSNRLKLIFAPLIILSVVLTFHRLDLIILFACGVIYFSKYASKNAGLAGNFLLVLALLTAVPAYIAFTGGESALVDQRLSENTLTGRFRQFGLVIEMLPQHPLGLGSESHPIFQETMIQAGHFMTSYDLNGRQTRIGLPVHNGYLGVGIKYGIAAMVVFTILIWKMARYFYARSRKTAPISVVPFFAALIWALSNLSNGIIEFRAYSVMIVGAIAGMFAGAYRKGIIDSSLSAPKKADLAQPVTSK